MNGKPGWQGNVLKKERKGKKKEKKEYFLTVKTEVQGQS